MRVEVEDLEVINAALKKGFDVEIRSTDKGIVIRTVSVKVLRRKAKETDRPKP